MSLSFLEEPQKTSVYRHSSKHYFQFKIFGVRNFCRCCLVAGATTRQFACLVYSARESFVICGADSKVCLVKTSQKPQITGFKKVNKIFFLFSRKITENKRLQAQFKALLSVKNFGARNFCRCCLVLQRDNLLAWFTPPEKVL